MCICDIDLISINMFSYPAGYFSTGSDCNTEQYHFLKFFFFLAQ